MQPLLPGEVKLPQLVYRQAQHQKVYYDTDNRNRPGWTTWANALSRMVTPLLPVVTGWRALQSIHEHKCGAREACNGYQAPGYSTKGEAREYTQVKEQDGSFGEWHYSRV